MTKFQKLIAVTLLTGLLGSSWAQAGGRHYSPHHHSYHRHSGDWILPAVVGGLMVYSVTQPRVIYSEPVYVQRAPVVIAPPPTQPLLAQNLPPVWYYCQSSQTYYPYVQTCQEGWRVVPASPGS
jgi:hypothetical protein